MLSRIIVASYATLLEISIWVILIGSFVGGWSIRGFGSGLLSLGMAFIFCAVFFGAFLVLLDIQKSVRTIEARQKPAL